MSPTSRPLAAALLAAALLSGCTAIRRINTPPEPDVRREWAATLAQARAEVMAGRFGMADHLLTEFAARHPASPEAFDVNFYRAVFKLDPTNTVATVGDAQVLLDAYLSAPTQPTPPEHLAEATTLRRMATLLERAPVVVAAPSSPAPSQAAAPDAKSRDEEVQRLRNSLQKVNAELDRIRRRVAAPKP